jgi:hypothetical protein
MHEAGCVHDEQAALSFFDGLDHVLLVPVDHLIPGLQFLGSAGVACHVVSFSFFVLCSVLDGLVQAPPG